MTVLIYIARVSYEMYIENLMSLSLGYWDKETSLRVSFFVGYEERALKERTVSHFAARAVQVTMSCFQRYNSIPILFLNIKCYGINKKGKSCHFQPINEEQSHALHAPLKGKNNATDGYRVTSRFRPITASCSHGFSLWYTFRHCLHLQADCIPAGAGNRVGNSDTRVKDFPTASDYKNDSHRNVAHSQLHEHPNHTVFKVEL